MNYSTLLNRSVDWEGELVDPEEPGLPAYASFLYTSYSDKVEQQLSSRLIQMLWDRGEGNGFAHHMTDDPLPDTPRPPGSPRGGVRRLPGRERRGRGRARTIGADFLGTRAGAGPALGPRLCDGPPGRAVRIPSVRATCTAPSGSAHRLLGLGQPDPAERQRAAVGPRPGPAQRPAQGRHRPADEAPLLQRRARSATSARASRTGRPTVRAIRRSPGC